MLVIGRRPGEGLVIGHGTERIEIEVLESSPSHVKLGIRANKSIPIIRKEILLIGEENQAAARPVTRTNLDRLIRRFQEQNSHISPPRR